MPTRRILSNNKLAPIQQNAINPFDSFNSDNINMLTRIVSGGDDVIVKGLDVYSADFKQLSISENLVKPYLTEEDFNKNWQGENYLYHKSNEENEKISSNIPSIDLYLPTGLTYGTAYIECKLDFDQYQYLFNKKYGDSYRDFDVSFDLRYGSPKSMVISINGSNCVIDHPVCNDTPTTFTFKIGRNFFNDNFDNGVTFKIMALFDTADQWNMPITNKIVERETFDFKTIIKISNIKCTLCQIDKGSTKIVHSIDGKNTYGPNDIHYVHSLKITPGIAIKDDVMLNIMGKSYRDKNTSIYLDLSDDYSWIKGKRYTYVDFTKGPQFAYQLNGKYKTYDLAKKECFYDTDTDTMKVKLDDNHIVSLMDDYDYNKDIDKKIEFKPYDYILNNYSFEIDDNQSIGEYSGTNLIIVYKKSEDQEITIARSNVEILDGKVVSRTIQLDPSKLQVEIINDIDSKIIDGKIYGYLSSGPIKVVSQEGMYDPDNVKWAYVVLYYAYFKNPKPNISYIGLVTSQQLKDFKYREDYLVLAKVRFVDPNTIDIISYDERQIKTLPSSNDINYRDNCLTPEIWDNVPINVTEAINMLRKQIINIQQKLDDDVVYFYKEIE